MELNHRCLRNLLQEFLDRKGGRVQSPRTERLKCRGWSGIRKKNSDKQSVDPAISKTSTLINSTRVGCVYLTSLMSLNHIWPLLHPSFRHFQDVLKFGRVETTHMSKSPGATHTPAAVSECALNDPVAGLQLQVVRKGAWLSHLENFSWEVRISKHIKARQTIRRWGNMVQVLHQMLNDRAYKIGLWFTCFWMFLDYVTVYDYVVFVYCICLNAHCSLIMCESIPADPFRWTCCWTASHQHTPTFLLEAMFECSSQPLLTKSAWQGARGSRHIQTMFERTEGIIRFHSSSLQWSKVILSSISILGGCHKFDPYPYNLCWCDVTSEISKGKPLNPLVQSFISDPTSFNEGRLAESASNLTTHPEKKVAFIYLHSFHAWHCWRYLSDRSKLTRVSLCQRSCKRIGWHWQYANYFASCSELSVFAASFRLLEGAEACNCQCGQWMKMNLSWGVAREALGMAVLTSVNCSHPGWLVSWL